MPNEEILENETEERIELHCHSKDGGNATMYPGELIRYASMKHMPAIAITDTSSILAFPEMERVHSTKEYSARPIYGMEMLVRECNGEIYTLTVLVKNQTGKESLFRIISESEFEQAFPAFPIAQLMNCRAGLLIGSGAELGKLRRMAKEGSSDQELLKVMDMLDYVELLPLVEDRGINLRLIELCGKKGIPAIAVSNAHSLTRKDYVAWKVLNYSLSEPKSKHYMHLYSTQEMMDAFDYLPKGKAHEIVVSNTHRIADLCESIDVCPQERLTPIIPDSGRKLRLLCEKKIHEKYEEKQFEEATKRLDLELCALKNTGMEFILLQMKELLEKLGLRACEVNLRGCAAGSIAVYLLGISEIDPLLYGLAPEFIFGSKCDRLIDIDINLPQSLQAKAHRLLRELQGVGEVVTIGCVNFMSESDAKNALSYYALMNDVKFDEEDERRVCGKIVGAFCMRDKHPGGAVLLPQGCDSQITFPSCIIRGGYRASYFDYYTFDHALYKADLLTLDWLDALRCLSEMTGTDLAEVPSFSMEVMVFFQADESGVVEGCDDIPGFENERVRKMIEALHPQDFDDLVKISGLSHGTDVWEGNGEVLVQKQKLTIKELLANRDDVFEAFLSYGVERELAFKLAEAVRKGMIARRFGRIGKTWKNELDLAKIPDWFIWFCEHVGYLFPRAHAISYVNVSMRLAWFKYHFPKEYAAVMEEYSLRSS